MISSDQLNLSRWSTCGDAQWPEMNRDAAIMFEQAVAVLEGPWRYQQLFDEIRAIEVAVLLVFQAKVSRCLYRISLEFSPLGGRKH